MHTITFHALLLCAMIYDIVFVTQFVSAGKFQMQVLPQCGHTVHEDVPDKVKATFPCIIHATVQ